MGRLISFALASGILFVTLRHAPTSSSSPSVARGKPHAGARAPAARPSAATSRDAGGPAASDPGRKSEAAGASSAQTGVEHVQTDAGLVETKTLDGGTQVFKFGEVDIEGRLQSPELVYFLKRVRAEFAATALGHRTFLREMSETRKEPTF